MRNSNGSSHRQWRAVSAGLSILLLGVHPTLSTAQSVNNAARDTTQGKTQTQAPFFTGRDLALGAMFAGATALMIPLDRRTATSLRNPSTQANRFFRRASTGVEWVASPGSYLIGASLYMGGTLTKHERLADLGWHGSEAVLFAQGVTYVIKGLAGRARPNLSAGEDPDDFRFARGFKSGDWTSFPSGHTSTAFAAAAAVTNETTRWWPKSTWIVGPLMYGGATAVGLSRMYHSRHWGSDVAVGAAIGTFAGRKVIQYAHGHPDNRVDRMMLRWSVRPDGHGGTGVGLSIDW
jgi:hypothetical protein